MNTDMEQHELEQEIYLMPHHQEVNPSASPCWEEDQVPSDQWDIEILRDNLEEEMHNISFNKSHHRVVQSRRFSTLNDHTSLAQFEEWLVMSDVHKIQQHSEATRAYPEATSSSVRFLIAENKQIVKEIQMTKKGGALNTTSTWVELKKAILDEVLSLDKVMRALFSKFGTMHKEVFHLNRWQQRCARRARIMLNVHVFVDDM